MNVFTFTREGPHCVRSKPNCIILSVDLGWEGQLSFSYVLGGSTRDWSWRELLEVETWYSVEIKQHFSRDKVLNSLLDTFDIVVTITAVLV